MEVNDILIDKLADLARLTFEGKEREGIKADLEKMLDFVDTLNSLDTEHVEPLIYMCDEPMTLRADEPGDELSQDDALRNAPAKDSDYFKVPRVLGR